MTILEVCFTIPTVWVLLDKNVLLNFSCGYVFSILDLSHQVDNSMSMTANDGLAMIVLVIFQWSVVECDIDKN